MKSKRKVEITEEQIETQAKKSKAKVEQAKTKGKKTKAKKTESESKAEAVKKLDLAAINEIMRETRAPQLKQIQAQLAVSLEQKDIPNFEAVLKIAIEAISGQSGKKNGVILKNLFISDAGRIDKQSPIYIAIQNKQWDALDTFIKTLTKARKDGVKSKKDQFTHADTSLYFLYLALCSDLTAESIRLLIDHLSENYSAFDINAQYNLYSPNHSMIDFLQDWPMDDAAAKIDTFKVLVENKLKISYEHFQDILLRTETHNFKEQKIIIQYFLTNQKFSQFANELFSEAVTTGRIALVKTNKRDQKIPTGETTNKVANILRVLKDCGLALDPNSPNLSLKLLARFGFYDEYVALSTTLANRAASPDLPHYLVTLQGEAN
ncbi:MAG: hypothetical protein ABI370_05290, partial [Gammaproteobacteria bacterium]